MWCCANFHFLCRYCGYIADHLLIMHFCETIQMQQLPKPPKVDNFTSLLRLIRLYLHYTCNITAVSLSPIMYYAWLRLINTVSINNIHVFTKYNWVSPDNSTFENWPWWPWCHTCVLFIFGLGLIASNIMPGAGFIKNTSVFTHEYFLKFVLNTQNGFHKTFSILKYWVFYSNPEYFTQNLSHLSG